MKKMFLSVVLSCSCMVAANAQVSGGLKGGLNLANQDFEADGFSVSPDGRTAFHVGAFLNVMLSDNVGLQPEVLFSAQGSTFESPSPGIEDSERNFNYINIPILLRYQVVEVLSLHVGPQIGFLLNAEVDDQDVIDQVKGSDFSLAFGAQIDLPAGFVGGARYSLGISDINDTPDDFELKNNNFQIYIGFKLFGN